MRVFIGCSAKEVINKDYYKLAVDVSTVLAKRGHKLVFGGAELGMMGKCYLTFRYEDKPVKGVAVLKDADDMAKLDLADHHAKDIIHCSCSHARKRQKRNKQYHQIQRKPIKHRRYKGKQITLFEFPHNKR